MVAEKFSGAFRFENPQHQHPLRRAPDRRIGKRRELDQFIKEIRQIPPHWVLRSSELEKRRQPGIHIPHAAVLSDHGAQDVRIRRTIPRNPFPAVPDIDHIAQQPHGQPGIAGGLMLKQHINAHIPPVCLRREKKIGFHHPQIGIDIRSRLKPQRAPVDAGHNLRRKSVHQKRSHRLRIGKPHPEQPVVRMIRILVSHRNAGNIKSAPAAASKNAAHNNFSPKPHPHRLRLTPARWGAGSYFPSHRAQFPGREPKVCERDDTATKRW